MCLAIAYKNKNSPDSKICEYVTKVQIDTQNVILTDIMDNIIQVEGTLAEIDLEHNVIIIETVI